MGFIPSKICSSSSSEYVNQNEFYVVDFSLHDIQSSKTETSLKHRSRSVLVSSNNTSRTGLTSSTRDGSLCQPKAPRNDTNIGIQLTTKCTPPSSFVKVFQEV